MWNTYSVMDTICSKAFEKILNRIQKATKMIDLVEIGNILPDDLETSIVDTLKCTILAEVKKSFNTIKCHRSLILSKKPFECVPQSITLHILSLLTIQEVTISSRVSQLFHDTIKNSSPKLWDHFSLRVSSVDALCLDPIPIQIFNFYPNGCGFQVLNVGKH